MRTWLAIAALNGFISVAAGAFGAHALKERLAPELLAVFETGARYQMYHALALVAVAWLASVRPGSLISAAGIAFTAGIVLFSGSLYVLALTGVKGLGAVTPFGGLGFLAGWVMLGVAAVRG
ncbi:MAG: DUF423 domain-containing protein [Myxococcaceae bacterium]